MNRRKRYSPEVRERAVRLVEELQKDHDSQWSAMQWVSQKLGCTAETLRRLVRQSERDQGLRSGLSSVNRRRLLTHHQHPTLTRSRLMYCIDCEDINLKICGSIFDAGYSPKWVILACLFTDSPHDSRGTIVRSS